MFTKFTKHQEKLQLGFDMHSSVYLRFPSQNIQNGCCFVLCSIHWATKKVPGEASSWELPHLGPHTCWACAAPGEPEKTGNLLGLPKCKSKALFPTSTSWDCTRIHPCIQDTAEQNMLWKPRSTMVVFHQSPT